MKKEQMVGARLSPELVRSLELIGDVEQSDRSTIVRRLLSQGVQQWKLSTTSGCTGMESSRSRGQLAMPGCPCGR